MEFLTPARRLKWDDRSESEGGLADGGLELNLRDWEEELDNPLAFVEVMDTQVEPAEQGLWEESDELSPLELSVGICLLRQKEERCKGNISCSTVELAHPLLKHWGLVSSWKILEVVYSGRMRKDVLKGGQTSFAVVHILLDLSSNCCCPANAWMQNLLSHSADLAGDLHELWFSFVARHHFQIKIASWQRAYDLVPPRRFK